MEIAARIMVLGGGFAGLQAVRTLARRRDVQVRLVDARPASEFAPLYPDLISGRIRPHSILMPLAPWCRRRGVEFTQAEVHGIDLAETAVQTSAGRLQADGLLIALGMRTNYFGNAQAEQLAPGIKSVAETLVVRRRALDLADRARRTGRRATIVVVGGGYTGIETVGHLLRLLTRALDCDVRRLRDWVRIEVVEIAEAILQMVAPDVADWTARRLESEGVAIRTGVTVESFPAPGAVRLSDGTLHENAMAIWTAGVRPVHPIDALDVPRVAQFRPRVDEHLRLEGCQRSFLVGDAAGFIPSDGDEPLRQSVQFSLSQGRRGALNLHRVLTGKSPRPFGPIDLGYVVPLAEGLGAGSILGVRTRGRIPYYLHYAMSTFRSQTWRLRRDVLRDLLGQGPSRVAAP